MAGLAAVVAVDIAGFAAVHSNVAGLATPVAFHFVTGFLDVPEAAARVALLLVGMVAVAGHVASLPACVARLVPLLLRLLTVPGDVARPAAVVACILTLFTVPSHVSLLSTPVADLISSHSTSTPPATAATTPTIGAVLEPMPRSATSKAVATVVHVHYCLS